MSDRDLRARLIRLAHAHPEFRDDILPLVTATYEQDADPKAKDQSKDDYWNGLDPKKPTLSDPALPPKTAKLMSRQEILLRKYMEMAARNGNRAATDWDELPDSVREALRRVKDQETLWMDVNRWFMDNAPASRFRWSSSNGQRNPMSDAALRKQLIRLAHANPEMRPYILPIVTAAAKPDPKGRNWKEITTDPHRWVWDDGKIKFQVVEIPPIAGYPSRYKLTLNTEVFGRTLNEFWYKITEDKEPLFALAAHMHKVISVSQRNSNIPIDFTGWWGR